jgi:hypothetical protein
MTDDRPSNTSPTDRSTGATRLSKWAAVLMSLAALATSWASYQASLWSGEQAAHSASASAYRAKSTRASNRADQLRLIDIGSFAHWMTATASHDSALAGFVAARFRKEFKPVFEEWIASRPLISPDAASSPFALPSYRVAEDTVAEGLDHAADGALAESQRANRISDSYVLNAVIMATVLFFAGAEQGGVHRLRFVMLLIAAGMFVTGVVRLLDAPRA